MNKSFLPTEYRELYKNPSIYVKDFLNVRFTIVTTKFLIIVTTDCRELTCCENVTYVVSHEGVRSLLFLCIVPILRAMITFGDGYVKCSMLYKGDGLRLAIREKLLIHNKFQSQ
jgi:hypothetical protein